MRRRSEISKLTKTMLEHYRQWTQEVVGEFDTATGWKTIAREILADRDRLAVEVDRLGAEVERLAPLARVGGLMAGLPEQWGVHHQPDGWFIQCYTAAGAGLAYWQDTLLAALEVFAAALLLSGKGEE
ncbi:MAG: hypothetical protein Q7T05_00425 [Dehalococcoidia bacterium]|nr:hypothetical protein [Dehalococcoidia bacterium]